MTALPPAGYLALAGLASVLAPGAAMAGSQVAGSRVAAACAACHRLDGRDTALPPVAGADEAGIVRALLAYRAPDASSQIMHVVAGALSPEEIAAVAHYLAAQPVAGATR